MLCGSSGAGAMGFIAHCMNTARINPAVIKVEQRANCQRIINCFVCIANCMQSVDVSRANVHRVKINFAYEPEQRLLRIGKGRRLRVGEHSVDKLDGPNYTSRDGGMIS